MRNLHIILLSTLCVGTLLTGIGIGIAFNEFTALEYEGTIDISQDNIVTEDFEIELEEESNEKYSISLPSFIDVELIEDDSVPEDKMIFTVSYDKERVTPQPSMYSESGQNTTVYLDYYYHSDDFNDFMKYKDDLLSKLKDKKIVSYDSGSIIEKVIVTINPNITNKVTLYK